MDETFRNKKWEKMNVSSISYKVASNCKWLDANIDYYAGKGPKYKKTSYSKMKKMIKLQRSYYTPGEDFDSPVGITIVVKKGEVVKVVSSGS